MSSATKIIVLYSAVDGYRKRSSGTSLTAAREFAHHWVGAHPELGSTYAISDDGIGKIIVSGATLADLFPDHALPEPARETVR